MTTWTVESAIHQIRNGGPTRKTRSAMDYLNSTISQAGAWRLEEIAYELLNALVAERGLANLGTHLKPLPDETETVVEYSHHLATGE